MNLIKLSEELEKDLPKEIQLIRQFYFKKYREEKSYELKIKERK